MILWVCACAISLHDQVPRANDMIELASCCNAKPEIYCGCSSLMDEEGVVKCMCLSLSLTENALSCGATFATKLHHQPQDGTEHLYSWYLMPLMMANEPHRFGRPAYSAGEFCWRMTAFCASSSPTVTREHRKHRVCHHVHIQLLAHLVSCSTAVI